MTQKFEDVAVNRLLGMRLISTGVNCATLEMVPTPAMTQETGVIHGGILTVLADTAAVYAFRPSMETDQLCASIEFKMNFLAPAFVSNGDLIAKAKTLKVGSRVAVIESTVTQGETQIAKGVFTYLIWRRG